MQIPTCFQLFAFNIALPNRFTLALDSSYIENILCSYRATLQLFLFFNVLQTCLQDEVLAISDKVVIRADDLLNWCDDTINWRWGLRATTMQNKAPECESIVKTEVTSDSIKTEPDENESTETGTDGYTKSPGVRSLRNSLLDFADIETEKGK